MHDPTEEPEDADEIDLEMSLAAGPNPAVPERWPDFEAALDDAEPQPERGDFCEPERPEFDAEW